MIEVILLGCRNGPFSLRSERVPIRTAFHTAAWLSMNESIDSLSMRRTPRCAPFCDLTHIDRILPSEREKGTNGRASIKWPPKGKSRRKAAAMTTFVLFASCRSHLRSGVIRSHSWDLIGFHLGKACFDVRFSRYESRLSPSIRRRPRLLPGQVTTTLEIKPASINL